MTKRPAPIAAAVATIPGSAAHRSWQHPRDNTAPMFGKKVSRRSAAPDRQQVSTPKSQSRRSPRRAAGRKKALPVAPRSFQRRSLSAVVGDRGLPGGLHIRRARSRNSSRSQSLRLRHQQQHEARPRGTFPSDHRPRRLHTRCDHCPAVMSTTQPAEKRLLPLPRKGRSATTSSRPNVPSRRPPLPASTRRDPPAIQILHRRGRSTDSAPFKLLAQ